MRLVVYITGHGFGHATRCIAVVNQLPPRIAVTICTSAPRSLFAQSIERSFDYEAVELDIGAVQRSALDVDPAATLERYAALWERRESLLDAESRRLEKAATTLALCDIPALGVLAARRAGIPALAMTNFSWDWIYREYTALHPAYSWLVEAQADAYAQTEALYRLPFAGDLSAFPRPVPTPLVARPLREPRAVLRERLRLRDDRPAVLVSFGGFTQDGYNAAQLEAMAEFDFIFPGSWDNSQPPPTNVRALGAGDFYHPDLARAADIVLGKLGYGLVSECVTAHTPLVFVRRRHFAEQDAFLASLPAIIPVVELSATRFAAGDWRTALHRALQQPLSGTHREWLHDDGAAFVARQLVARIEGAALTASGLPAD